MVVLCRGVATTPGGAAASGKRDKTVEAAQRPYAVRQDKERKLRV